LFSKINARFEKVGLVMKPAKNRPVIEANKSMAHIFVLISILLVYCLDISGQTLDYKVVSDWKVVSNKG
jgi:hypothetical protein